MITIAMNKKDITDEFDGDIMNIIPVDRKKINTSSIYGDFKKERERKDDKESDNFIRYCEYMGIHMKEYQKEMVKMLMYRGSVIDRNSRLLSSESLSCLFPRGYGNILSNIYFDEFNPYVGSDSTVLIPINPTPSGFMFIFHALYDGLFGNYICFSHEIGSSLSDAAILRLFRRELKFKYKMTIRERIELDIKALICDCMIKNVMIDKNKRRHDKDYLYLD